MPNDKPKFDTITIDRILALHKDKRLNLEPGFQRRSVWGDRDRRRLIESIIAGYPLPSVFLYQRENRGGRAIYDVIDGKQRIETILMFMGVGAFKHDTFNVRMDLDEHEPDCDYGLDWWSWDEIGRECREVRRRFYDYEIQTVKVDYPLAQIVELFVRINSTGKPLTGMEKRHAQFFDSPFLKEAEKLIGELGELLSEHKILSKRQIARMKGTELMAELLMSIQKGGIINKKVALNRALGNDAVDPGDLRAASKETKATVRQVLRMFPGIKGTRFRNTVDFYSLCLTVWEMRQEGFALADASRRTVAQHMLRRLSNGVDEMREHLLRQAQSPPARADQELYRAYCLTVQGDTDSSATRERRAKILRGLLNSIFERTDARRVFTLEQRRILWNSVAARKCGACRKPLTWGTLSVDHVKAWSKGGRTRLDNAQLLCKSCNSRKGAR